MLPWVLGGFERGLSAELLQGSRKGSGPKRGSFSGLIRVPGCWMRWCWDCRVRMGRLMLQMVDWVVGLSNDSQLLMFGLAAGAFEIAADAHDAGLVVLGLAIWCLESWLMLMMLGLLCWEFPLVIFVIAASCWE